MASAHLCVCVIYSIILLSDLHLGILAGLFFKLPGFNSSNKVTVAVLYNVALRNKSSVQADFRTVLTKAYG